MKTPLKAAALLTAVALLGGPVRAQTEASDFSQTAKAFIEESEQRDPLFADNVGIHTYDDRLDDYSPAGHARRIAWLQGWHDRLASLDAKKQAAISNDDAADIRELRDSVDLELYEDRTVAPVRTDATSYESILGDAMYSLVGRHYATPEERLRHVAPRLALVPGVVRAAEAMLTSPPRVSTLQAIDENAGTLELYESLTAEAKAASPATRAAIAATLPAALASIRTFGTFLQKKLLPRSTGNPRIGATAYDAILALQDGTDESRTELVADAQADFDRNRTEMLRLALPFDRKFFPDRVADEQKPNAVDVVVRRVMDKLAADNHPTRETIFPTVKSALDGIVAFLGAHPVVVLPLPSTLHVVPTPDFMAGFAGASMSGPGPFSPMAEAYYYIDKIPQSWSAKRVDSYLRDFNDYELRMLSIHEAIPGHYVQFRYGAVVPSLVRRVFGNGSYVEGWAVYGEGMMLDSGYDADDPAMRLFQLKWRLREEADTLIDAAFHTGTLTEAQCRDILERQAYEEESEAETKWHRLNLSHVQLTTYFAGLDAIRKAQAAERARLGAHFDLAAFNAKLLNMGAVEPRYILPLIEAGAPSPSPVPSAPPSALPKPAGSAKPTATPLPLETLTPQTTPTMAPSTRT